MTNNFDRLINEIKTLNKLDFDKQRAKYDLSEVNALSHNVLGNHIYAVATKAELEVDKLAKNESLLVSRLKSLRDFLARIERDS